MANRIQVTDLKASSEVIVEAKRGPLAAAILDIMEDAEEATFLAEHVLALFGQPDKPGLQKFGPMQFLRMYEDA